MPYVIVIDKRFYYPNKMTYKYFLLLSIIHMKLTTNFLIYEIVFRTLSIDVGMKVEVCFGKIHSCFV